MPRVIAGSARGIELRQPRGRGTRPTSGRLREALFSMLEAAGADFTEVLDLYAGTGALGIEALSRARGAEQPAHATFVESDARAAAVLRGNLARVGLSEDATAVTAHVGRWRPPVGAAYTLVVADPPYDEPASWDAISETLRDALAPHAVVAVEHSARVPAPERLGGLVRWRDRRQGDGAVAIYRARGEVA